MSRGASLLAALPDFAIAAVALVTWWDPQLLGPEVVAYLFTLMLLEFVVMHSAAFMGVVAFSKAPRSTRVTKTLGLGAFYTLFAGGFAVASKSWWPLLSFWGLVANRLLVILVGAPPSGREEAIARQGWAVSAFSYMIGVFVTLLLPLPALGVEPWMAGPLAEGSSGVWVSHPEKVVAFAALYFALVGFSTARAHTWKAALDGGPIHAR